MKLTNYRPFKSSDVIDRCNNCNKKAQVDFKVLTDSTFKQLCKNCWGKGS